jgi:hypothetical protein
MVCRDYLELIGRSQRRQKKKRAHLAAAEGRIQPKATRKPRQSPAKGNEEKAELELVDEVVHRSGKGAFSGTGAAHNSTLVMEGKNSNSNIINARPKIEIKNLVDQK